MQTEIYAGNSSCREMLVRDLLGARGAYALGILGVLALLSACGGGGSSGGDDPVEPPGPPNSAPTAEEQSVEGDEDEEIDITLSGSDSDGDVESYTIVVDPASGSLSGIAPELTYTPDADFNGTDTFEFTVTDDDGAESDPATVTITLSPVNDPPVANPQSLTIDEDAEVSIALTGSDVDGTVFAYKIVQQPSFGYFEGSPPNLMYYPDRDFNGTDSIGFLVEDDTGLFSDVAEVTITVTSINDAPIFEDEHFRVYRYYSIDRVELQAIDVDGEIDFIEIESDPSNGTAEIDGVLLTYQPESSFIGEDEMTVVAQDLEGERSRIATLHFWVEQWSPDKDREILTDFFESTGGSSTWIETEGWGTDLPLHQWYGLWTWGGGYAGQIALATNGVTGEIPREFLLLGRVFDFLFESNHLSGEIPPELTGLPTMRTVDFRDNDLEGTIPWHVGKLASISNLRLSDNQLGGTIPRTIVRIETLRELYLGNNQLEGRIYVDDFPRQLESLSLNNNSFWGPVPPELGELRQLRHLYLEDSGLSGRLPFELMALQKLEALSFSGNSGDICASGDSDFQDWLSTIPEHDVGRCNIPPTIAVTEENKVLHLTTGITTNATNLFIQNEGDTVLEVTITTSDSWLTVSETSLNIDPFRSMDIEVFVECGSDTFRRGTITISTNDPDRPTREIEVKVECLERDLTIEYTSTPDSATGSPGARTVSGTVEWQMNSSTDDERGEPYTVTMASDDQSIVHFEEGYGFYGTAVPEETNAHELEASCRSKGTVTLEVSVAIGNLSESSEWAVECEPDVYRVAKIDFYQGPFVARQTLEYSGVETESTSTEMTYNTPVIPDRRAVVSFTVAHGYDAPAELERTVWKNGSEEEALGEATNRGAVAVDSGLLTFGDVFTVHLPAPHMTGEDSDAELEIEVSGMDVPFTFDMTSLDFSSVAVFKPVILPYTVDPEDGNEPEPTPDFDMDDLLTESRDWLPIADDSPRAKDTIYVSLSEIEDSENPNSYILSHAAAIYNEEGEEDEFYHAVWFSGVNGFSCGGGVAFLGWQVGMSCAEVTAEDESGSFVYGREVVAHEFGHNFSLSHTPCGAVGYADPDYPYANANMGPEPGWSYVLDRFIDDNDGYVSYMSYCQPDFVSDYDYRKSADWFLYLTDLWAQDEEGSPPVANERDPDLSKYRSIALMGQFDVESGTWKLLQAEYSDKPPRTPRPGDWELILSDRIGIEFHRESMRLHERHCSGVEDCELKEVLTWFARVPIPVEELDEIRVFDPQGAEAFKTRVSVVAPDRKK